MYIHIYINIYIYTHIHIYIYIIILYTDRQICIYILYVWLCGSRKLQIKSLHGGDAALGGDVLEGSERCARHAGLACTTDIGTV